jgi:Beta-propeller repeat
MRSSPSYRRGGHVAVLVVLALAFACGHAGAAGLSPSAVEYSALLGGGADDQALAITQDSAGNTWITGKANSTDFPTTADALERSFQGGPSDAYLAKFGPSGNLLYSTYLGGVGVDEARGVAVTPGGAVYVAGFTSSPDFPGPPASGSNYGGGLDAFVIRIGPGGSPEWSRYIGGGGDDKALALALDGSGNVYLTGEASEGFPTTPGAFQRTHGGDVDSFAAKVGPTGGLAFSGFLGGPQHDDGLAITLDGANNAYVTGKASPGFPVTAGAYDVTQNGGFDMYVTKVRADGSALDYSTFLGGSSWDEGLGIATDGSSSAYVTGNVQSPNYPTTPGAFDSVLDGQVNSGITKLNPTGSSLVYSTLLGRGGTTEADGLALGRDGGVVVAGHLDSPNLPVTPNAVQPQLGGVFDGFLTKVNATGTGLVYSTYYGGSGWDGAFALTLDPAGSKAFLAGQSASVGLSALSGPSGTLADFDAFAASVALASPTAVKVSSFTARRVGHAVRLHWRTRSEAGVAGFELRRGSVRVGRAVIGASGSARGRAYRFEDRKAPRTATTYRLFAVRLDGSRKLVATARVA